MAYVYAVAAQAGIKFEPVHWGDYGIDGTFTRHKFFDSRGRRRRMPDLGTRLDCQLKATTVFREYENSIHYDLEADTHRHLATQNAGGSPVVLVVLCMPEDREEWVVADPHSQLRIRKTCYFTFIDDEPSENDSTQVVSIPKSNQLTPEALVDLFQVARDRMRK